MKRLLDFIKKLLGQSSSESGFTLIELLVVIAIIGVLMVGTLVALNPVAQINKSKDANAKGKMDQAITAVQAYFTGNNSTYPANKAAVAGTGLDLTVWPQDSTNTDFAYTVKTASCTGGTCPSAVISFPLLFGPSGQVYCWRAYAGIPVTGDPQSVAAASCTAP